MSIILDLHLQVEEFISNTTESAQKSVTYFLNECMSIEVQSRFSIRGSPEKLSFYDLKIRRAVIGEILMSKIVLNMIYMVTLDFKFNCRICSSQDRRRC